MYRKRILSVISAAVLLLSGCSINDSSDDPQNSGENLETTSFSATENVPENEITQDTVRTAESAAENAASAETAVSETTASAAATTTATTEPLSKEELIAQSLNRFKKNTHIAELPSCDVDMSEYKGKFYEWEYDMSIVSETESDFPAQVIESAHAAVDKYFLKLLQEAEKQEESTLVGQSESYILRLRYPAWGQLMLWYYDVGGDDYNKCFEGDCGFEFREAACADFDGDGNEEYFIVFEKTNRYDLSVAFTVFVSHEGTIEVLNDAGLSGAYLNPVKYTGFTHMLIASGISTSSVTLHTSFYAVENGSAVFKHHESRTPVPYNGVFMKQGEFRYGLAEWLIFWNEELNEYCSFLGNPITDDEAEALFEAYAIGSPDEPPFFSGVYKDCGKYQDAQTLQLNTRKIGNLYCVESEDRWYTCYEYRDGSFFPSEEYLRPADTMFGIMYAEGIDFEYLEGNTAAIE